MLPGFFMVVVTPTGQIFNGKVVNNRANPTLYVGFI